MRRGGAGALLPRPPGQATLLPPPALTRPSPASAPHSLYVTLALFLMSVPGIWSQIKRAPRANRKRKTFAVPGPAAPGAMPMDERARQIFAYFKSYNYKARGGAAAARLSGAPLHLACRCDRLAGAHPPPSTHPPKEAAGGRPHPRAGERARAPAPAAAPATQPCRLTPMPPDPHPRAPVATTGQGDGRGHRV